MCLHRWLVNVLAQLRWPTGYGLSNVFRHLAPTRSGGGESSASEMIDKQLQTDDVSHLPGNRITFFKRTAIMMRGKLEVRVQDVILEIQHNRNLCRNTC